MTLTTSSSNEGDHEDPRSKDEHFRQGGRYSIQALNKSLSPELIKVLKDMSMSGYLFNVVDKSVQEDDLKSDRDDESRPTKRRKVSTNKGNNGTVSNSVSQR